MISAAEVFPGEWDEVQSTLSLASAVVMAQTALGAQVKPCPVPAEEILEGPF